MELKFYYRPHHSKTSWWKALQFIRQQWLLDVLGIVCVEQRPSVKGWCVVFGSICGKRLHFHDSHSWTLTVAQRALAKFHAALRPYPRIYQKVNNSRKLKKFCSQKDKVYCCYRGNGFINMIFFTVLAVNFYVFFFFPFSIFARYWFLSLVLESKAQSSEIKEIMGEILQWWQVWCPLAGSVHKGQVECGWECPSVGTHAWRAKMHRCGFWDRP